MAKVGTAETYKSKSTAHLKRLTIRKPSHFGNKVSAETKRAIKARAKLAKAELKRRSKARSAKFKARLKLRSSMSHGVMKKKSFDEIESHLRKNRAAKRKRR